MGTINKIIKKSLQHVFTNNNHWILVKIYISMPYSHCPIYDSKIPLANALANDAMQLFLN
jgi:hypothetical protein